MNRTTIIKQRKCCKFPELKLLLIWKLIRLMLESIDKLDSIILTHAAYGKAGSFFSGTLMDYIHDNFNVKKWCHPMLQISTTIKEENLNNIKDENNMKNLFFSPVQAYVQSSNLASQYIYNNSNCTTIINYDTNNTKEKYDLQNWKSAYALTSLLQPSNEKSFYPEMTGKGFKTDYKKNYNYNWSFSTILKNYSDPRPLSLHFSEIKQYDSNSNAINDFKNLGLFSCHNIVLGQQHYKNYENLIFRSSHLIIDSWKNFSCYKTPLGSLSSWSFFINRKNYLFNNLNSLPER